MQFFMCYKYGIMLEYLTQTSLVLWLVSEKKRKLMFLCLDFFTIYVDFINGNQCANDNKIHFCGCT